MNIHKKNRQTLLHLFLIEGVGSATSFKIIEHLSAQQAARGQACQDALRDLLPMDEVYAYTITDFIKKIGITRKTAELICEGLQQTRLLDEELELIKKHKVRIVTLLDKEYPALLRQIYVPPTVFYCHGEIPLVEAKRIAFVGSRQADDYAHKVIKNLVPPLVEREWEIVSGGATGADTMAHQAAIDAGGKTIVVLGSGLLNLYPSYNKDLFRKIIHAGGTLLSSFALRTQPDRHNFPIRNRVIAGLSSSCVVVQAAAKSGALITADYALNEGRQLFAVPGSIYHELSKGCHELIANGAKLVHDIDDILEEFGEAQKKQEVVTKEKNSSFLEVQDPLLKMLHSACTVDELSCVTGLSLPEVHDSLFQLQLEGKVRQCFTGAWERIS